MAKHDRVEHSRLANMHGTILGKAAPDPNEELERGRKAYEMLENAKAVPELIARFQLESERAVSAVRDDLTRVIQEQARKVAQLEDKVTEMTHAATRQAGALEDGLHHTRKCVEEVNEAMKVAAKAAQEARDSAAVYEKLRDSQPDYAAQVRGLERRLAEVVDKNTHLEEMLAGLTKQLGEFEVIAGAIAS